MAVPIFMTHACLGSLHWHRHSESQRSISAVSSSTGSIALAWHGAHAAGTSSRFRASQSFEACTAVSQIELFVPEPTSRFAVRRQSSGWCPTGALRCFPLVFRIHQQGSTTTPTTKCIRLTNTHATQARTHLMFGRPDTM